jgi:carbonic anhydrase
VSIIDETLKANELYAKNFSLGHLAMPPARKLAILACMDARLTVEQALGLKTGEAHIIRNAGGIATDDAVRSLIISHYLLGTQEFAVISHTDCGMLTFKDEDLAATLRKKTGADAIAPARFYSFTSPEDNVREQVRKLKSHPWIPRQVPVRGFVYDVKSGKLLEVKA